MARDTLQILKLCYKMYFYIGYAASGTHLLIDVRLEAICDEVFCNFCLFVVYTFKQSGTVAGDITKCLQPRYQTLHNLQVPILLGMIEGCYNEGLKVKPTRL